MSLVRQGAVIQVRRMTVADLDAVVALERAVYDDPWPMTAYEHEITDHPHAHYWVAYRNVALADAWPDLEVVGFGGLWLQYDEVHISTLAVHPAHRRQGIGELLLLRFIDWAIERGAAELTLEVRASNLAAQALYAKYGFATVGHRRRYYDNNGEDALIMTSPPLTDPAWRARVETLRSRLQQPG